MKRKAIPSILLLSVLAAAAFPGCAWLSKPFHRTPPAKPHAAPPPAKPPAGKPPAAPPVAPPAAKPPAIPAADKLFAEGLAAMQEGGYERALDLFSAAWQEKPGHAGVAHEFDGAMLALKKSGDTAYAQGKWEAAGRRWMGTLRFITHPAANWRSYPFTRSDVRGNVDRLNVMLMERALKEYRKGALETAIGDWRTILSYDPLCEDAAHSLRTASKQLETLKNLPPGK